MELFIHFQDFVDAYVGPFNTYSEVGEHIKFTNDRGDGATVMGIVTKVPEGEFTITPQDDRDWME